jgi:mRNA interferase HigB
MEIIAFSCKNVVMFLAGLFFLSMTNILINFPKWELGAIMNYMRVVKEKTLRDYWEHHANVRGPLEAWYEHVRRANWTTPQDVQKDYGDDAILPSNRAVFNIKGKDYRLVVQFHYKSGIMFIRFIGTHAEYNHIDATKI